MLGVRNPYRPVPGSDDGLDKTGTVWFDELRLTDFDQRGGWAATARVDSPWPILPTLPYRAVKVLLVLVRWIRA
jgi:hypothetical protein